MRENPTANSTEAPSLEFSPAIFGREVKVEETKCIAKGDPYRKFEVAVS